ncbi:hypothetical protein GALMADRAFT_227607 [Galerina marginata CBS 339.88]|uniref:Cation efflux protein n=1 Tax=Galerina marginata (strain CBS 339.88) TaxID=685588 RepID=A0A067SSG6_GALM3|nr:hypothetical protein GALMADRAFT_227607 [Galerina marginata CBS 339.88]
MAWSRSTRIIFLLVLDTIFFLIELIIGYAVGSLALVADSFHMLNDIISLIIALYAIKLTSGPHTNDPRYSYGWHRAEILAALVNGVFLLALCVSIFLEAISRFFTTPDIDNPKLVAIVGAWGLASNFVGLTLFHEHDHDHDHGSASHSASSPSADPSDVLAATSREYPTEDFSDTTPLLQARKPARSMNMQALILHVIGDALGNVGVIATGLIIWKTNWSFKYYCDPVISLFITLIIFSTAMPLVKRTSFILLQGVPTTVSLDEVRTAILKVNGVDSLHELHVWQLSENKIVASVHVRAGRDKDFMPVAVEIRKALHRQGIHSCTIQPEYDTSSPITDSQIRKAEGPCLILCPADDSCEPGNACCPPPYDT